MLQSAARVATDFANRHCPGSFEKYGAEWFRFYNQKFAELIVRECAAVADKGYASDNFGNGITGTQLLKHLGVGK